MTIHEAKKFLNGKTLVCKEYKDKETCYVYDWYNSGKYEIRIIKANGSQDVSFIVPENMVIALAMGEEVIGYRVKELIK